MRLVDLGRRRRHDPANRRHQSPHRRAQRARSVRHPLRAPHVDQFYLGGCVGFSGTNLLNTSAAWRSRVAFNRLVQHGRAGRSYLGNEDGLTNYHESTVRDPFEGEYPPDDTGSSATGLGDYWHEAGIIGGFDWVISGGMDVLIASVQATPCLFGSYWFDDMMSTDAAGVVTSAGAVTGGVSLENTGGHEYLCNAVLWGPHYRRGPGWWFGFEQSWGEHPEGFKPTFYMRDELVEHLIFGLAGDVMVPKLL